VIGAADNVMQPLAPSLAELEGGGPSPQWTFDPKVLRRPWFQLQEWNSAAPEQEPVRR
jgi:hypothetical protein